MTREMCREPETREKEKREIENQAFDKTDEKRGRKKKKSRQTMLGAAQISVQCSLAVLFRFSLSRPVSLPRPSSSLFVEY
ncbi:hypothetical protein, partial [Salmonella enterica]|uniref:hypothetical protein n=1 Tax=Salmonella enterica TaxID=28901 RepID=UPI0020C1E5EC